MQPIVFFSDIFGFILNTIYNLVQNYGIAIILFSILIKIVMLPISIKQQTTRRKTAKLQGRVKELQKKYKGDPQKMNSEIMSLYRSEKMSPFSGCLGAIVQMVLIFAMFILVRNPLTHMRGIDSYELERMENHIRYTAGDEYIDNRYAEISIIRYVRSRGVTYIGESEFYINMDFAGLDLSDVPSSDWSNWTVYVIPALFVLSSAVSIRLTMSMNEKNTKGKNEEKKEIVLDKDGNPEPEEPDMMASMNKSMMWMMPIMSLTIAFIAPLGLALYWLLNNILMITEISILNKFVFSKEEAKVEGE